MVMGRPCHLMASSGVARVLTGKLTNQQILRTSGRASFSISSRTMAGAADILKHYAQCPSLPVPKLNQTLEQYIRTVKPLITKEEFAITEQVARNFAAPGGVGQKLQHMLEEKASKESNWLSTWWLDAAYLSYRLPVVVHSNPALVFPKQNFNSQREQLEYASKLVVGALHYKSLIDGAKLEQEYLGKAPVDMSQYTKLFNGCRIPALPADKLRQISDSKHIIVAFNNSFFKLNVYVANGQVAETGEILEGLLNIVRNGNEGAGVGYLTTESRDVWAVAHQALTLDPENTTSLRAIEDSILVLCLDKVSRVEVGTSIDSRMALQFLHGYGSDNNSGNRWFDKTIQIMVGIDGVSGLCYEHSPTEGGPVANLSDYIVDYALANKVSGSNGRVALEVKPLQFNLTADVTKAIDLAKRNVDLLVQDLQMNSFTFDKFGKEDIKTLKLSPDSFIQIAIQMAFIRLHGHPAAHYESASIRKFTSGRTETIRSCLPEIVDFAMQHLKSNQPPQTKFKAFQAAMKAHKEYVQLAVNAQGVDRHLLGLKKLAIENGMDIPVFYLDPGYSTSNNWRLSTSQIAARHDMVTCYGPVVPDGYGCCYNPRKDEIKFAVSAFNSNPTTCANKFGEALSASLTEIREIASSQMPSKL